MNLTMQPQANFSQDRRRIYLWHYTRVNGATKTQAVTESTIADQYSSYLADGVPRADADIIFGRLVVDGKVQVDRGGGTDRLELADNPAPMMTTQRLKLVIPTNPRRSSQL